ncbi:MAG: CoA transferase [Deltaproteobacteria bacterium]|nr:CoA transferase [Deltaproteobacteria bacterium]
MSAPLRGVRVIDLTRLLPGPYACRVLAELGADVVKVESPEGGDWTRHTPPLVGEVGALFLELNVGKRSVALDLKRELHRRVFLKLVESADVLVDGNRPGVLERLGLAPEYLIALNPRLVYAAITGFGLTGPDRGRAGHDIGYSARAGVLSLTGHREAPMVPGVQVADVGAALFALVGIQAALVGRASTGRGGVVDVSLAESAMAFGSLAFGALSGGVTPQRGDEMLDGSRPCYTVYAAKDGRHLAVGALEPKFWMRFCEVIGEPELVLSGHDVGAQGQEVRRRVADRLLERTRDEWMRSFSAADCCVEPVLELSEAKKDAQLVFREAFDRDHGFVRSAARYGDRIALTKAPQLGEHTAEVLRELGFAEREVEEVIRGR